MAVTSAPVTSAPAATRAAGVNFTGTLSQAEITARQKAATAASDALARQSLADRNAAEDRARKLRFEDEDRARLTAAPQQSYSAPASMAAISPQPMSEYDYAVIRNREKLAAEESDRRASQARAEESAEADRRQASNVATMQSFLQQVTAMPGPSSASAPAPAVPLPGQPSASDLAFARAKDKAGVIGSRAMEAARSSGDSRAIEGVISGTANKLTDVALGQAVDEAGRAHAVDDRNYAGTLQQRQQNLSLLPSMLSLLRY